MGIGTTTPFTTLHVKGTVNVFYNASSTHTGNFWAGTSNVDGVEIVSSVGGDAYISVQRAAGPGMNVTRASGAGSLVAFNVGGSTVGLISTDGSTTTYSTVSDVRLKENINPTKSGLSILMKMNVKDYNFISDTKKILQTGFLAQDLYKLYPQAVHAGGENVKTDPWTIDYSKLTPVLVKGMQEQQQVIEKQQQQINELIERLNKLEKGQSKQVLTEKANL